MNTDKVENYWQRDNYWYRPSSKYPMEDIIALTLAVVIPFLAFKGCEQKEKTPELKKPKAYFTSEFSRLDAQQAEYLAKEAGLKYTPTDRHTLNRLFRNYTIK